MAKKNQRTSRSSRRLSGERPSVKASRKVIDPSGVIETVPKDDAESKEPDVATATNASASGVFNSAASDDSIASASGVLDADQAPGHAAGVSGTLNPVTPDPAAPLPDATGNVVASPSTTSDQIAPDVSAPLPTITEEEVEAQIQKQKERISNAERERKRKRRRKIVKWVFVILALLIVAAVVAICVAFAYFRWNAYDDATDIRGTWVVEGADGSATPIVISEDSIRLTDDVAYSYTIDPDTKTLRFSFGNMSGSAKYRFSLDRDQLMIEDGEVDWWGSLFDDAQWTATAFIYSLQNDSELPPDIDTDGSLLMTRDKTTENDAESTQDTDTTDSLTPNAA